MALAQAVTGNTGIKMMDVMQGNIGNGKVKQPPKIQTGGPLKRRFGG